MFIDTEKVFAASGEIKLKPVRSIREKKRKKEKVLPLKKEYEDKGK